ncbi:MAG: hypothetical protein IPL61_32140 [Myxococcales bacterium]|nr:hypothetical protein [Myxococcales bacterium]
MPTDDEIVNAANKFFRTVGSAVKKAGTSAVKAGQSVTGLGRGDVRVTLDALRARAGAELRGTVALALTEPIDARRLVVELRASQRGVETRGGVRAPTATTLYKFEHELGGAQRYHREQLAFTLPVPRELGGGRAAPPAGRLGDVARAVSAVVAPTTGPVEWKVVARLVVPLGRDLDHAVDVLIDGLA